MQKQTDTAKAFKEELLAKLIENPQTNWGKNQLIIFIKDCYTEFIERYID